MPWGDAEWNKMHRRAKSALTRAKNTQAPKRVLEAVRVAWAAFTEQGFPYDWSTWRRAGDDAVAALERKGIRATNPAVD